MREHVDEGSPCEDTATTPAAAPAAGGGRGGGQRATPDGYPMGCGDLMMLPGAPTGRTRLGGRNVTMAEFMASVRGGMDRPVVDHTSLKGRYDWWIEYVEDPNTDGVQVASSGRYLDPDGPRLFTAFQQQLGLQL